MARCNGCGGVIGRDCFNPVECVEIGHRMQIQHSNSNDQFINQLQSELSWERDVVQQDLLQKLTTALTMLETVCVITKGLDVPENHAKFIEGVIDFYNELRDHKLPQPVATDNDDGLPF